MDIFKLVGRVMVDAKDAQNSIAKTDNQALKMADSLGKGIMTAAKWGTALVSAATAAGTAIAKQSIEAYAQYEQLAGGIETLFKNASAKVEEFANNAYKTAGLSANEYMDTITSFSASLLASLGNDTDKAAEYANKAVVDMSDNANKMGTDIKTIQNAYQGFAKQNYTMLDNLKLGYGGTKTEMQRLLKDAEKLPAAMGRKFDLSNYADIVDAIHLVQDEMGICGATAEEASSTIEGSVKAMKSSWQNLLVGIASDNANYKKLVNNFVDSATTAADNLLPRIETVLTGLGNLITTGSETILPKVIDILMDNLPILIDAGIELATALLTSLFDAKNVYKLVNKAVDMLLSMVETLSNSMGNGEVVSAIGNLGKSIATAIWDAIKKHFKANWNNFTNEVDDEYGISDTFAQIRGDGKHASGLNYVPYDGYVATLHKGERVVPASQNGDNSFDDNRIVNAIENLQTAMTNLKIELDGREVGQAVAPQVDRTLGNKYSNDKRRGFASW